MGSIIKSFGVSEGQKRGGGLWIPEEIFSSDLSAIEKFFVAMIGHFSSYEECFASNEYFAEKLNLTSSRCSQIITSLEKKGIISRKFFYGKNGQIEKRVITLTSENFSEGVLNFQGEGYLENKGGYLENCEDNKYSYYNNINKYNNKTTTNNIEYIYEISEKSEYQDIFNLLRTSALKISTINNIMKLVAENSIPLVRINTVLEYGKEKNWNDGAIYEAIKDGWILKSRSNNLKFSENTKKNLEKNSEKISFEYSEGEKKLKITADLINDHKDLFTNIFSEKLKLHNNNQFIAHAESLVELRKRVGTPEIQ
ncbi:MAG: hypothetical protein ACRCU6_10200 [Fusobacteriaceae bacterium]